MRVFIKTAGVAAAVLLVAAMAAPRAEASEANDLTYITFSAPVALPGVALPAGTYRFKITGSEDSIVQVSSRNGHDIYATLITIPDFRHAPASKTVVTFHEVPEGEPEAINTWFYPGRLTGRQFIYTKAQSRLFTRRGQPLSSRQG